MISAWSCILTIALLSLLLFSGQVTAQLVPDFRVNDDITSGNQFLPKIGVAEDGSFVIVWRDSHNGSNILCRRYSATATVLGPSFRINVIADTSGLPDIAVKEDGSFGVCWRAGNATMFGQTRMVIRLFNNDGSPKTGEIFVNDTLGNFSGDPAISINEKDGSYIVTWSYTSSTLQRHDIYYQSFDSAGNKVGNNVLVNDYQDDYNQRFSCITIRQDGSFIIAWEDLRPPAQGDGTQDIYMQMFDSSGSKTGVNRRVNDDTAIINGSRKPKISSDESGAFVLAWSDDRLDITQLEIFAQLYNTDGTEQGVNFRVSQHSLDRSKGTGGVSKQENGEFVIGWREQISGTLIYEPYLQRYQANGQMVGSNYLITSQAPFITKDYSDVKLKGNRIYSVWVDNRTGDFDVYCNILSFINPDSTVNINPISQTIPESFKLHQNFPNPFNPTTNIKFSLPSTQYTILKIFDALGREVATLVNENLTAGSYNYQFSPTMSGQASDNFQLGSGVYFYRLSAGEFSETKRLVLLK